MQVYSQFLREYLLGVEHTESPRIFHLWCALSGISAALGRRCYLPFGDWKVYPNQCIILVGPPGSKKGSAMSVIEKLIRAATGVRLLPSDTAGQRQGLIVALQDLPRQSSAPETYELSGLGGLLGTPKTAQELLEQNTSVAFTPHPEDKHSGYVVASEFTGFIGRGNQQFLTFLCQLYDTATPYEYQLKNNQMVLTNPYPMLNILSGTTSSELAESLPPSAHGQGILSRMIFVAADGKERSIPRPRAMPEAVREGLMATLRHIWMEMKGAFVETPAALKLSEELYETKINNDDPRFVYYADRRYIHMLKLACALAASRGSMTIEPKDHEEANTILRMTESKMPQALGQYGLNKLAVVKHMILEYLRGVDYPLDAAEIFARFHRDGRQQDITECIQDLVNAGDILRVQTVDGHVKYAAKRIAKRLEKQVLEGLIQQEDETGT